HDDSSSWKALWTGSPQWTVLWGSRRAPTMRVVGGSLTAGSATHDGRLHRRASDPPTIVRIVQSFRNDRRIGRQGGDDAPIDMVFDLRLDVRGVAGAADLCRNGSNLSYGVRDAGEYPIPTRPRPAGPIRSSSDAETVLIASVQSTIDSTAVR